MDASDVTDPKPNLATACTVGAQSLPVAVLAPTLVKLGGFS